jgi:hypothetical protein
MRLDLINPPAIIAASPEASTTQRKQENIAFKDKLRRQLFTGKINKRGEDGRTYNYIDKDGNYISSFLSPYNKEILENVEPKIKNLISALITKGYLTAGSCQGHPNDAVDKTYTRWISIAFISDEERANFIKTVDSYKLPIFWYFNFLDYQEAPKLEEKRDGITMSVNMKDAVYKTVNEQKENKYTKQDLTDYWNIMFCRNYTEYYPVKLCICSCPGDVSVITKIKILLTWPFRDHVTKKLVKHFEALPQYYW